MALVRERIADGRVLRLIEGFLKQGVIEGTDWHEAKEEGTPQGGVISPLLASVADLNRTLKGWYGYFKHVHTSEMGEIDQWLRMRLRSILRKRRGGRGRGRGLDHHRWPNRYFTGLGLFCLLDAKAAESASLRLGANH